MDQAQFWSDLPGDLLTAVYGRVPTALDRVRLTAVCRSWRAAVTSRHRASPALPWLLYPRRDDDRGTERLMYCPEDGGVIRISLPTVAVDRRLVGSHDGGWVAAYEDGPRLLSIVNLFSGYEVTLSENQRRLMCTRDNNHRFHIRKLVFSEAPTSNGCILVAITKNWCVAISKVGCPVGGWTMAVPRSTAERVWDLAFCNGELYGLTAHGQEELMRYEIGEDGDGGAPVVNAAHHLAIEKYGGARYLDDPVSYATYLLELCGKPVITVRARWSRNHEPSFRVFELSDNTDTNGKYKWVEVTSLGDYAFFVGPMTSCKAANIAASGRGGVESNHVYYFNHRLVSRDYSLSDDEARICMDDNGGPALYSGDETVGSDGTERKIVSVRYYVADPRSTIWLFPPDL